MHPPSVPGRLSPAEYRRIFPPKVRAEALKQALDIRKFEIDLYWKRATYFWALIAVAFAGYLALSKESQNLGSYVVACLGLLFSVGWYCVNRGSGAWQRNWEAHVDMLEDAYQGPLYKTVVDPSVYRLNELTGAFYFSPSRINNILSLAICGVWLVLALRGIALAWSCDLTTMLTVAAVTGIALLTIPLLLTKGQSRLGKSESELDISRRRWIQRL